MARKSIFVLILSLFFCSLTFAQEAIDKETIYTEKIYLVFISKIVSENSEILELRNFNSGIPAGCKTEPNTKKAKICDALKQFAKEHSIKFIVDGDELEKLSPYIWCGENLIDVTENFVKFYNAHFVKKND